MSEQDLVLHCAPTLAGIKTGSLFTCHYQSRKVLLDCIRQLNLQFARRGLRLLPLRFSVSKALIYLYRPGKLRADLSAPEAMSILCSCGYKNLQCDHCVACLARKLRKETDFPHEIGLFLGYPPEDVHGFMENNACGSKCTGCWKVYGDEVAAKKKFDLYRKCTRVYCDCHARGRTLEQLVVAG